MASDLLNFLRLILLCGGLLSSAVDAQKAVDRSRIVEIGSFSYGSPVMTSNEEAWAPAPGPSLVHSLDGGRTWRKAALPDPGVTHF